MLHLTSTVIQEPLESIEFTAILSSFCDLLQSAFGPHGGLKMIVTGGGYTIVTSSSSRIVNNIVLDHPVCLFISQIMKSQLSEFKDCGLYTGILTSSLVRDTLSQQTVPLNAAATITQQISSFLVDQLGSIKINVDFSTVKHLLPLVRSILRSKPACRLSKTEEHTLSVNIVKAFLGSVGEGVGDVIVVTEDSSAFSNSDFLYPGILYQRSPFLVTDQNLYQVFNDNAVFKKPLPLLLFNVMLSNESPKKRRDETHFSLSVGREESFSLEKTLRVLKFAVGLGVLIVACQKVVHPDICLYLQRSGVLLLDRMGTELTRHVEQLSGAKPVSDVASCVDKEFLIPYLGHVSTVRSIQRGQRSYVLLERENRNTNTLIIGGINSEAAAELKVVTEQALHSLRHLLHDPYLVPGAGCLEMVLVAGLESKVQQAYKAGTFSRHRISHVHACLRCLQLSTLLAGGFTTAGLASRTTDTAYYHSWQPDAERPMCRCGLVTRAMVHARDKRWISLDLNATTLLPGCDLSDMDSLFSLNEESVVDLFASKFSALKLSLESFSGLLNIGMIVYKPTT